MRTSTKLNAYPQNMGKQSGFALIVGLVVLLLLTLIMLTALKLASLEERMAGNLRNQNIAFQAAESALRDAEELISSKVAPFAQLDLRTGPFQQSTTPVCVNGLCQRSEPLVVDGEMEWPAAPSAAIRSMVPNQVRTISTFVSGVPDDQQPQYVIELLTVNGGAAQGLEQEVRFRITARAQGQDPNSLVILQSVYRAFVEFVDEDIVI